MDVSELLIEQFGRIHELYQDVASELTREEWQLRPDGHGNPIVWLLWHLARVQDDHVAELAGVDQAWATWRERFDLPLDDWDHGYGHTSEQVDAVRIGDLELLAGHHAAVHGLTLDYVRGIKESELDRVVDDSWDPPVTVGVRLVSVVGDCLQHLGQAAYVKGLA